jgi:hypothetical protein
MRAALPAETAVIRLNLTDIHITWVETRAVLGKRQEGVRRAMETIRQALPF